MTEQSGGAEEGTFLSSEWFNQRFGENLTASQTLRPEVAETAAESIWTCFICTREDEVLNFEGGMCDQCFQTQMHRWAIATGNQLIEWLQCGSEDCLCTDPHRYPEAFATPNAELYIFFDVEHLIEVGDISMNDAVKSGGDFLMDAARNLQASSPIRRVGKPTVCVFLLETAGTLEELDEEFLMMSREVASFQLGDTITVLDISSARSQRYWDGDYDSGCISSPGESQLYAEYVNRVALHLGLPV